MDIFSFIIFGEIKGVNSFAWTNVGYLVSVLKKKTDLNVHVDIFDIKNIKDAVEYVEKMQPNFVGLPLLQMNLSASLEFIVNIKKKLPHTTIIVGNIVASCFPVELMNDYQEIDYCVIGEGEETLLQLCGHLVKQESVSECDGIAYRDNNRIILTKSRPLIKELDTIPFPDRSFADKKLSTFYLTASRGCYANCTFCDANTINKFTNGKGVRTRSIENVLDEVEELINCYNCKIVFFTDSTFCGKTSSIDRLNELYIGMKKRNLWVAFDINLRCDQINMPMLENLMALTTVGLSSVFLGIEAANDDDLKLYGKNTAVSQIHKAISLLQKNNILEVNSPISIKTGFINFNPYTTIEKLKQNVNLFLDYDLHFDIEILLSKLALTPTTPINKKIQSDGLLTENIAYNMVNFYQYRYVDEKMNKIYNLLSYCDKKMNYRRNFDGFIYYKRFWDKNELDYKNIEKGVYEYSIYRQKVKNVTAELFQCIIDNYKKSVNTCMAHLDHIIVEYNSYFNNLENIKKIDDTVKMMALNFYRTKLSK